LENGTAVLDVFKTWWRRRKEIVYLENKKINDAGPLQKKFSVFPNIYHVI